MVTRIYEGIDERFPDIARPEWYDEAVRYLRGGVDEGLFGLYIYELIRTTPDIETVLNIGTARGHSTVCAARALTDDGRSGSVHTIDVIPPDQNRTWHGEKHPSSDPLRGTETTMRKLVARFHDFDSSAVSLTFHTGRSSAILDQWDGPEPDLVFHDGLHQYETVRTDIRQSSAIGDDTPIHVFDDCYWYAPVWSYRPFTGARAHAADDIPKLGGIIRRGRQFCLTRGRYAGVGQAVDEAFEEWTWRTLEVVRDRNHAPITSMFPE